jgi:hypothetical protein
MKYFDIKPNDIYYNLHAIIIVHSIEKQQKDEEYFYIHVTFTEIDLHNGKITEQDKAVYEDLEQLNDFSFFYGWETKLVYPNKSEVFRFIFNNIK